MTDLFNSKAIDKICRDVKVTPKSKDNAIEWLNLLKQDKLRDEEPNYDLFQEIILENILGYTRREIKRERDNVEFSITNSSNEKVLCIEAKGTKMKDLTALQHRSKLEHSTPIKQTWDYMGEGYEYGICTNYKHFILLIKKINRKKYHLFDFDTMIDQDGNFNEKKLQEFIGIFSKEKLIETNTIEKLQNESEKQQNELTDEFYELFHDTRLMLIKTFDRNGASRSHSIYGTQLILNRLLFIFFAQDKGFVNDQLLFRNAMLEILMGNLSSKSKRIWNYINEELFHHFDKGSDDPKIFGFNGGLFSGIMPDKIFFNDIENEILVEKSNKTKNPSWKFNENVSSIINKNQNLNPIIKNLLKMDSYDFNTQVSVNILGHIFEQSISDLEDLRNTEKSLQHKTGVYYTPEYITDYICRNIIIKYLSKSKSHNIKDVDDLIAEYDDDIEYLEHKLRNLKILDPACGSGAFLVKIVDILLEIHKEVQYRKSASGAYIVDDSVVGLRKTKKTKKPKQSPGTQIAMGPWNEAGEIQTIMEDNIYGVDINRESVGISRLAMFFKIASDVKKLPDLTNNIKMGNSLIDDKNVDSNAFDWKNEFPEIFSDVLSEPGFDIIVGNPPYVSQRGTLDNPNIEHDHRQYYRKSYKTLPDKGLSAQGGIKLNLFALWIEKSILLLNNNGCLGMIVHKNLLKVASYKFLRNFLLNNTTINEIFDLGPKIFNNVVGETILLTMINKKNKNSMITIKQNINLMKNQFKTWIVDQNTFHNTLDNMFNIYRTKDFVKLIDKLFINSIQLDQCYSVISFGLNTKDNKKYFGSIKKDSNWKKAVMGRNIGKYIVKSLNYVYYDEKILTRTGDVNTFESDEKLILQRISGELIASYDDEKTYCYNSVNMIVSNNNKFTLKYLLCLLNSKLINYYYVNEFSMNAQLTFNITQGYLSLIPIKNINLEKQKIFINKADEMILNYKEISKYKVKLLNRIKTTSKIDNLTINVDLYHKLPFVEFVNKLSECHNIKLSLNEQDEWEDYFERYKKNIQCIEERISSTDMEINDLIYQLYGITKEERNRIEQ